MVKLGQDIGEACHEPIRKYSWKPGRLYAQTYERHIRKLVEKIVMNEEKVRGWKARVLRGSWSGSSLDGLEDAGGLIRRVLRTMLTPAVTEAQDEKPKEALEKALKELPKAALAEEAWIALFEGKIARDMLKLEKLKLADCLSGGHPDLGRYMELEQRSWTSTRAKALGLRGPGLGDVRVLPHAWPAT